MKKIKAISCSIRTRTYANIPMRLEISSFKEICNALSTVQKDTLVLLIMTRE